MVYSDTTKRVYKLSNIKKQKRVIEDKYYTQYLFKAITSLFDIQQCYVYYAMFIFIMTSNYIKN